MTKRYIKDIERIGYSFFEINAWYLGESDELSNLLGFGFYNTFFEVNKKNIAVYYDEKESKQFYRVLDEKLSESFFNSLCADFFKIISESENLNNDEKIFDLMAKSHAILSIFHEISIYPEYANEFMIRRSIRIRRNTESFFYKLSCRLKWQKTTPENYIFYKREIFDESFSDFIRENNFEIIK